MNIRKVLIGVSMVLVSTLFFSIPNSQAEDTNFKSDKLKESEEIKFEDLDTETQKIFKEQGFTDKDKFYQSVNIDSN